MNPTSPTRLPLARRVGAAILRALETTLLPAALLSQHLYQGLRWRRTLMGFSARPDDIFIVTYPKSGTTWMQMILYQLLTDGSMAIPHIRTFSPFFEIDMIAAAKKFDALPSPRVFKTHLSLKRVYHPAARFIYVARDGMDVAYSYYHHFCAYNGTNEPFETFFERFLKQGIAGQHWFRHVAGAHGFRDRPNVLLLRFEDLLDDLEGQIGKIRSFCGLEIGAGEMPRILQRCGFAFMKEHEAKFEWATGGLFARGMILNRFIREGLKDGGSRGLPESLTRSYARQYERFLSNQEDWPGPARNDSGTTSRPDP